MTERPVSITQKRILELTATDQNMQMLEAVTKALSSDTRLAILRFLGNHTSSVNEIAEALNLPSSTATLHINILEKSGLIITDLRPAKRGVQKMCARVYDSVTIQLPVQDEKEEELIQISMPIGAFVEANVTPTCGLLSEKGIIGQLDNPSAFYEPERISAQLIWFYRGYVEYRFPNRLPADAKMESFEISFESCSEAPLHHPNWPSDISVWVNGVEIGQWTSPADFGGERGLLTPRWWDNRNTQYGLFKVWKVTSECTYVDGMQVSSVKLDDLNIRPGGIIQVRIGIREEANQVGGINLFGSKFGNYPQDIVLTQRFKRLAMYVHEKIDERVQKGGVDPRNKQTFPV